MKWLFLIYHLQTQNSRDRVKVWRLTKKIGSLLYRNSVYVLPYRDEQLEDLQWLCQQIRDSKGEASIFVSDSLDEKEDQTLRSLFQRAREEDYMSIFTSAENLLERVRLAKEEGKLSDTELKKLAKEAKHLNESFADVERIDFFKTPVAGKVRSILERLTNHLASPDGKNRMRLGTRRYSRKDFQKRVWATREHIHIDRLCSAWLIRRFIDPQAKFVFAPKSNLPKSAILFDVFAAEFSHHGGDCTFETLLKAFRLKDKALTSIAEIVHDVDMKDNKYGRTESAGLDAVVRALSNFLKDDHKVVEVGSVILDSLYEHFSTRKQKGK